MSAQQEFSMNLSSIRKRHTIRKKKSVYKPKIRWQLLGLTDPNPVDSAPSIDIIRREIASLARYSFGEDTRLRCFVNESKSLGRNHKLAGVRNKRSGELNRHRTAP